MQNQQWSLENFVDSLVVELDRARETLAVKSVNRPLSYTVKDLSLDLQTFVTYDDGHGVRFRSAQSGEEGASKITLQLASITDQQVRASSKPPPQKQDVTLDETDIEPDARRELRRMGVTSVSDLEKLEARNVDIEDATGGAVDYGELANLIQKARRGRLQPSVHAATLEPSPAGYMLRIEGKNLSVSQEHVPVAVLDNQLGEVVEHGPDHVCVRVDEESVRQPDSTLILTLDPYCLVRMQIKNPGARS